MTIKSGLTKRDLEMLKFINFFGKSYNEVLMKCFFPKAKTLQVCRNRLNILRNKYKLIKFKETGAITPRHYVSLSDMGRKFVEEELEQELNNTFFSFASMQHNMLEQITAFALMSAGKKVERTKVRDWSKTHNHTPDLIYYNDDKLVYVEIEISKKTRESYDNIFKKVLKDNVSNIIYVSKNEKWQEIFLNFLPKWDKLRVAEVESFFETCVNEKKVKGNKQNV